MNDIVWLVNPIPDTLYDLVLRLKDVYSEIFSSLNTSFKLDAPESIQVLKLSVEKRQNIYLIFKEAINNSLKYSKATSVSFVVEAEKNEFQMTLKDDGCGFENNVNKGNGLSNMDKRAKSIGAKLIIQSETGRGQLLF